MIRTSSLLLLTVLLAATVVPASASDRGPDLVGARAVMLLGPEEAPAIAATLWRLSTPRPDAPSVPTTPGEIWDAIRHNSRIELLISRPDQHSDMEVGLSTEIFSNVLGLLDGGLLLNPWAESGEEVRPYISAELYQLLSAGQGMLRLNLQSTGDSAEGTNAMVEYHWSF
jgi:hypothetical protein